LIFGGSGHDTIVGGKGADTIEGGSGHNLIQTGTGGTTIEDTGIKGHDTAVGFDLTHGDNIQFAGETAATIDHVVATSHVQGSNTTITLPDGSTMTLVGITHIDSSFFH